jgi:UDP-N-acetylmuramyl pentapeptide synthase
VEGLYFKIAYGGAVVPMYLSGIKKKSEIYPYLAAIAIALTMGLHLVEISEVLKEM